ncbi:MAG TPA: hypothetical protein VK308_07455, partial [Pyrinomonadaceae bacterium]|nr:hypothetical protein [Pyrinomonadaceae bacterium]
AMTADRPYRAAISETEAKRYLTEWAAIEFDPRVVKAFLALEIIKETQTFADEKEPATQAQAIVEEPETHSADSEEIAESEEIIETPENSSQPVQIFTHL